MLRKALFTLFLCIGFILPVSSYSQSFKGVYFTFQAGANTLRVFGLGQIFIPVNNLTSIDKAPEGGANFLGRFLLGYSHPFNHFYLGIRGGWMVSSVRLKQTNQGGGAGDVKLVVTLHDSYGVDITPGVFVNKSTYLYGVLGAVQGVYEADTFLSGLNGSRLVTGYEYGIGLGTRLTNYLVLHLEYSYIRYLGFTVSTFELLPNTPFNISVTRTLKLSTNQFVIGFSFYFGS